MADEQTPTGSGTEELAQIAEKAETVAAAAKEAGGAAAPAQTSMGFILDVTLQVTVEVGRARMTIQDLLQLGQGSVVELEKLAGEPLDIYINGKPVARGEAVIVNEKFGVRLTQILSHAERVQAIGQAAQEAARG